MKRERIIAVFLLSFLFLISVVSFLIISDSFKGITGNPIKFSSEESVKKSPQEISQEFVFEEIEKIDNVQYLSFFPGQLPSGLVSYWTFNSTFDDSFGLNNATCTTCPSFVNGRVGNAISFLSNENLNATSNKLPLWDRPRTMSAWVKINNDSKNYGKVLFGYGQPVFFRDDFFYMFLSAEGRLCLGKWEVNDGTCSSFKVNLNEEYFLSVTYDGKIAKIYMNGKEVGNGQRWIMTSQGYPMIFGGNGFNGSIDEFMIWNRSLTIQEINQTYYATGAGGGCVPSCLGKTCMNDPECGVSCGTCPTGLSCDNSLDECYYPCTRTSNCNGKFIGNVPLEYCENGKCVECKTGSNADCYTRWDAKYNLNFPVCVNNHCVAKNCLLSTDCNFPVSKGTHWVCDQTQKLCARSSCLIDGHCTGTGEGGHCCRYSDDPLESNYCAESVGDC